MKRLSGLIFSLVMYALFLLLWRWYV